LIPLRWTFAFKYRQTPEFFIFRPYLQVQFWQHPVTSSIFDKSETQPDVTGVIRGSNYHTKSL
jgi:hypothetical protein